MHGICFDYRTSKKKPIQDDFWVMVDELKLYNNHYYLVDEIVHAFHACV